MTLFNTTTQNLSYSPHNHYNLSSQPPTELHKLHFGMNKFCSRKTFLKKLFWKHVITTQICRYIPINTQKVRINDLKARNLPSLTPTETCNSLIDIWLKYIPRYTGWFINIFTIKNLNISSLFQFIGLIFLSVIEECSKFLFIRKALKNYRFELLLWHEYGNLTFNETVCTIFWKHFSFDFDFQCDYSVEEFILFRSMQSRAR